MSIVLTTYAKSAYIQTGSWVFVNGESVGKQNKGEYPFFTFEIKISELKLPQKPVI